MIAVEGLSDVFTEALAEVAQRVQRSLVVVHNGRLGAGAGVVWRSGGYIVTNNHVIAHGQPIVELPGGRQLPARLLAQDPGLDLALLQVEEPSLPAALVADSRSLRVGEIVLAVGHPWGQKNTLTAGVVSGLGKAVVPGLQGRRFGRVAWSRRQSAPQQIEIIRSDVSLAPGNSGGPLVNSSGGVVGINTMIVGGDLSVAVPSHVVSRFVEAVLGAQPGASPSQQESWI